MVMFFFITTAFLLASFSGSKDTRSRAAGYIPGAGGSYGRLTPTPYLTPKPTLRITPTPIRRITPTPKYQYRVQPLKK
jgi:hypothetical protein